MDGTSASTRAAAELGPPVFKSLDHVSFPCRDLEEGKKFYMGVLGGEIIVEEPAFVLFDINGAHIGIGSVGATFMEPGNEYPHIGFDCDAETLVQTKEWLAACGIPSTPFWTRAGVETLMFFRDPSGNVIELYCHEGYEDAPNLPRGPAQGHGNAIDIDAIRYDTWHLPGEG